MSNKPTLLNQARSSTARLDRFLSRPCLPSYILQTIHGILPARGSDADYPPHLWKTRTASNIISTTSSEGRRWPGARILVVESNNFQCHELISHLVEWGFDVSLVRDGEEALYHVQVRRPDIVIIDPIVPGLDGFEFCYEMKKHQLLASTPVILSPAGAVTEVDATLAQEMGAVGYASRAPDFRELDALLQTTFAKSQAALRSQKLP
jgi:PleD family two-component response regulator